MRVLILRRALYVDEQGELREKDTKTHQQRRIALDKETIEVLRGLLERCQQRADAIELEWSSGAYVFSPDPDGLRPLVPDTAYALSRRAVTREDQPIAIEIRDRGRD